MELQHWVCGLVLKGKCCGMKVSNIYVRQCGESRMCSRSGSMSVPDGRLKTSTTCCNTDNCTPPQPVLTEDMNSKNGVTCKGCFSPNSSTCKAEILMNCIGNETECVTQLTSTTGSILSKTISRGCSTKEMCEPTRQVWKLGPKIVNVETKCANSCGYLRQSLFPLVISVTVFLKLV
ncbi:phospholipase A2 inhibitor gamma subunit B-like isoform X2 [Pseudophryne corroboree]|uniref:phospholipase A2 inhibitor gamma subunit B-like isoform X2 n=1 Tax=Pseudophryne corroboree TaxID=495146 RepID=UPI0030817A78